ncbi:MAG: hypothetical protein KIT84_37380 [Labilithrix sp.]|nr:hypothetical protein [Labilithrix sp.]MCW5816732.1 hypothetical protein [Labilithrix sp.]
MRRRLASFFFAAAVLAACKSARPPEAKPAWCERVRATADASGDLTGRENTAERVLKVKKDIQIEALGCGAGWVGVGYDPIMSAVVAGRELPAGPGLVDPNDRAHTLIVFLSGDAPLPVANPLYVDGVRVYFIGDELTPPRPEQPVPETAAPPAPSRGAWCRDVPLTADPAGDETGKSNTQERVLYVKNKIQSAMLACAGVNGISMTPADAARAVLEGKPPLEKAVDPNAPVYAITVALDNDAPKPVANPLFIEGVRVYFLVGRL